MGSLILVLMVFDRRAKLAANERNRLAAEALVMEHQKAVEKAKLVGELDFEKAKQEESRAIAKRDRLVRRKKELTEQEETLRRQMLATQRHWESLDRWIKESKDRIQARAEEKESMERRRDVAAKDLAKSRAELTEKQKELARLDRQIQELKELISQLKVAGTKPVETHSIIPYLGKRGENRKPIYVECQSAGYVFHPYPTMVSCLDLSRFQEQILVRSRAHQLAKGEANASIPPQPYLLLLVRPDGIENYWKAQAFLKQDRVDFGYELIDGDWKLDFPDDAELTRVLSQPAGAISGGLGVGNGRPGGLFSGDGGTGAGPPGRMGPGGASLAGGPNPGSHPRGPSPGGAGRGPFGQGLLDPPEPEKEPGLGVGPLNGLLGQDLGGSQKVAAGRGPIRGIPPGREGNGSGLGGAGNEWGSGTGSRATGQGTSGPGNGELPAGSGVEKGGMASANGPGFPGIPRLGGPGNSPMEGAGATGTGAGSNGGQSGAGLPGSRGGGNRAAALDWNAGGDGDPTQAPKTGSGAQGEAGGFAGQPANTPAGAGQPGAAQPGMNAAALGTPGAAQEGGAQGLSLSVDLSQPKESPEKPKEPEENKPKRKATYTVGASLPQSETSEDEEPNALAKVAAPVPGVSGAPREPKPLRVARLDGGRDFIIYVECVKDGLVIHPDRLRIHGQELETEEGAKKLLELLSKQVERKSRPGKPGEKPPQGQIRFLVRPDGLRWYHASFPLVEEMNIRKSRQNLDFGETIQEVMSGR